MESGLRSLQDSHAEIEGYRIRIFVRNSSFHSGVLAARQRHGVKARIQHALSGQSKDDKGLTSTHGGWIDNETKSAEVALGGGMFQFLKGREAAPPPPLGGVGGRDGQSERTLAAKVKLTPHSVHRDHRQERAERVKTEPEESGVREATTIGGVEEGADLSHRGAASEVGLHQKRKRLRTRDEPGHLQEVTFKTSASLESGPIPAGRRADLGDSEALEHTLSVKTMIAHPVVDTPSVRRVSVQN